MRFTRVIWLKSLLASRALLLPSRGFVSAAAALVLIACLTTPRGAQAQVSAAEAADFYTALFDGPPMTCTQLGTGVKSPEVFKTLCAQAKESARLDIKNLLTEHIKGTPPGRKALINGGGVSMGSYQAGRLQGLINDARVEALTQLFGAAVLATDRRQLARVDERLSALLVGTGWANLGFEQAAGASAGGMNAVGFAIEVCRHTLQPTFAPETADASDLDGLDSVLRRMWMDVGFETSAKDAWTQGASLLADDHHSSAERNALFSVTPLNKVIGQISRFFAGGTGTPPAALRPGCGMGVSITVTSLKPVEVSLRDRPGASYLSITIPVMVDLRVSSSASPVFEVKTYEAGNGSVMTLKNGHQAKGVEAFFALVRATGALPPALPIVTFCEKAGGEVEFGGKAYALETCPAPKQGEAQRSELNLIDGGVFNNNPLDLVLDRVPVEDHPKFRFYFFDQDFTPIPRPASRTRYRGNTLYVHFQTLLSGVLLDVARNQQVSAALRRFKHTDRPDAAGKPQVVAIGRESPAFGEAGFATSAFLLREFRELDYLAGVLDSQREGSSTWVSQHADVKRLGRFYTSHATERLEDEELVALVDDCLAQPSVLAHGQVAWGRRCLLAAAARLYVQNIRQECGENPTSPGCVAAAEFVAMGDAIEALEDAGKRWQFADGLKDDIREQMSTLGERLDDLIRSQPSSLGIPARVLDVALEGLFIDGLRFSSGRDLGPAKGRSVMRGQLRPVAPLLGVPLLTDVRLTVDRSFLALEVSRRSRWLSSSALDLGFMGTLSVGLVPALSVGAGLGCTNYGDLTLFACEPRLFSLEGGSTSPRPTQRTPILYGDVSAELVALRLSPLLSFHLAPLVTARGAPFVGGTTWGLEAGGLLRMGLFRTVSLDVRMLLPIRGREGTGIVAPFGRPHAVIALGLQM